MVQYIEKEALKEHKVYSTERHEYVVPVAKIDWQPAADVEEIKYGKWVYHPDDLFPSDSTQEYSVCHEEERIPLNNENYCPNCGAKMDKE